MEQWNQSFFLGAKNVTDPNMTQFLGCMWNQSIFGLQHQRCPVHLGVVAGGVVFHWTVPC